MSQYQIAVIVGSLRQHSFNRRLANAIVNMAPSYFSFKQLQIGDLPLFNQDDDTNQADSVKRLKSEIKGAQGVLFVTPEYNRSIPGVLKNATPFIRPVIALRANKFAPAEFESRFRCPSWQHTMHLTVR